MRLTKANNYRWNHGVSMPQPKIPRNQAVYSVKEVVRLMESYHQSELKKIQKADGKLKKQTDSTKPVLMDVQSIYDAHKLKLNNLKESRINAEEEKWTDAEIKSVDDQIKILASVLSDLHRNVLNCH